MLGHVDWEKCQSQYRAYWMRENHEKPLIWVTAPKDGLDLNKVIPHQPTQNNLIWLTGPYYYNELIQNLPPDLEERWLDSEKIIERAIWNFSNTFYGGEAFPILFPDLGADIMGGILGSELELGEYTTWCKPSILNWDLIPDFHFHRENAWWQIIEKMTREMVAAANGDFFVSITDIHPGVDSLVALRGPDRLSMDLYDHPKIVKEAILKISEPFKEIFTLTQLITAENQPGSSNWMGAWHPGRWHTISADFMALCSNKMFREFILPEVEAEANWLDASIFHLDGPDTLRHLNTILDIEALSGIAWLPGAGKPPLSQWIPMLKQIQARNKVIQAEVYDWEIPILMQELKPEGVLYITSCKTKQDALDLLKVVNKSYVSKK